jgi:hypothetical protein
MFRKRYVLPAACLLAVAFGTLVAAHQSGSFRHLWEVHVLRLPILDAPAVVELEPHEYGTHAEARFAVTNYGGGELILDGFRSACACDGLERKTENGYVRLTELKLAANESAELRLVQQVRGRVGEPLRTAVYFRTNVPTMPEAIIVVAIPRVLGGITAVPSVVHVGTVPAGANVRRVINLYDAAAEPRVVREVVVSDPSRFGVRLLPPDPDAPARGGPFREVSVGRLEVVVNTVEPGLVDGNIRIILGDGHAAPDTIRVSGRVCNPVEVSPPVLVLPRVSNGRAIYSGRCLCRSTTGRPLTLEPETSPPGVTITGAPDAEDLPSVKIVTVEVDPGQQVGTTRPSTHVVRLTATVDGVKHPVEIQVQVLSPPADAPSEGAAARPRLGRNP